MMKATGALTILLLSTTYSSPVLDLNFGENIGKEKSSGFDATEKADLTSGNAAGTSRYSFIWASPLAWLNSLSLVNNDGYYLTTAQKTKDNVFFNGTNVYPISFALAGAGMIAYAAAYLVSQLPSSGQKRAGFRSDEYYDDDYSLDRDHDSDIYAFEEDDTDYDYQYPEKEDGWNYAGTNQRLKKDRIGGGGGGGRRPRWQRRRPFRRHRAPGLLERIANFVSAPVGAMARVSHAVNNPGGFLKQFANRYDAYWEKRRGVGGGWRQTNRGAPRQTYSRYSQQYRTEEGVGPQLPLQKSFENEAQKDVGGQQQLTGSWEDSADSFAFGKQIHR